MGLDCWVYTSEEPFKEEEIVITGEDGTENTHVDQSLTNGQEIWYGRKTHSIMDYLLKEASFVEDNCRYISLDHLDLDELKLDFTKEFIVSEQMDGYELECFKDLIDALSEVPEDMYLYFYAWY